MLDRITDIILLPTVYLGLGVFFYFGVVVSVFLESKVRPRKWLPFAGRLFFGAVAMAAVLQHFILAPAFATYDQAKLLIPHLQEYASIHPQTPGAYNVGVPRPEGKVVIVDLAGPSVDDSFFDLPESIRATRPEEVGTIVLLRWSHQKVGQYGNSATAGDADMIHCEMYVYILSSGQLLYQTSFIGGSPPSKSENGTSQAGSNPTPEIIDSIVSLYGGRWPIPDRPVLIH